MNKLTFQVIAFIAVLVGLVWAKKNFIDAPKQQPEELAAPIHADSLPSKAFRTSDPAPASQPKPQPQFDFQAPAAPVTATSQEEDNAISKLLHKFTGAGAPQDRARVRIKAFMQAWKEGGTSLNDSEQAAACLFARGKLFIPDQQEIRDAYEGFVAFRKAKNLYTDIADYSIGDPPVRSHDEVHGDYTEFDVTINNYPHTIGVPDKANPLFWVR